MDWRAAYHDHIEETRAALNAARHAGRTAHRLSDRAVDASDMSDWQIDIEAIRDAERVVNMAIHLHNEELERRARR